MNPPRLKTGIILPTFADSADEAIDVAHDAEDAGIDGVFCYDHIWPMGQPTRPALAPFPVLGALASSTSRLSIGTLVARVGLIPNDLLICEFETLKLLAPGRVIAGLGTGDRLSAAENVNYGITFGSVSDRLSSIAYCTQSLKELGIETWIGGGSRRTLDLAHELKAVVNLWGASPDQIRTQAKLGEVTWAGMTPEASEEASSESRLGTLINKISAAGASWIVLAWPTPLDILVEVASKIAI